jgi:hypothetical protein
LWGGGAVSLAERMSERWYGWCEKPPAVTQTAPRTTTQVREWRRAGDDGPRGEAERLINAANIPGDEGAWLVRSTHAPACLPAALHLAPSWSWWCMWRERVESMGSQQGGDIASP